MSSLFGGIQLNWPLDHTGWQLQAQTNNLTTGLGTNWVNISSSAHTNQLTVPATRRTARSFSAWCARSDQRPSDCERAEADFRHGDCAGV
jgi:hypothetical protein